MIASPEVNTKILVLSLAYRTYNSYRTCTLRLMDYPGTACGHNPYRLYTLQNYISNTRIHQSDRISSKSNVNYSIVIYHCTIRLYYNKID